MTRAEPSDRPSVRGAVVDDMTRCVHYRSVLDIVAIRFACCGEFYPCHLCHEEYAGHRSAQWPMSARDTEAVLCGACGAELTITEYLDATACPRCDAPFNPGCSLHAHLYFEVAERSLLERPAQSVGTTASAATSPIAPDSSR